MPVVSNQQNSASEKRDIIHCWYVAKLTKVLLKQPSNRSVRVAQSHWKCGAENVAFFLLQEALCDPKICLKCDCGRGSAPDPAGELTTHPHADSLVGWGGDTPQRLRRLDPRAFGACQSATPAVFWQIEHWHTPLLYAVVQNVAPCRLSPLNIRKWIRLPFFFCTPPLSYPNFGSVSLGPVSKLLCKTWRVSAERLSITI